jgi:hypothetical protein
VECEDKNDASNNRAAGTTSEPLGQYLSNIPESTTSRNYTKQPYCASADVTVQNF